MEFSRWEKWDRQKPLRVGTTICIAGRIGYIEDYLHIRDAYKIIWKNHEEGEQDILRLKLFPFVDVLPIAPPISQEVCNYLINFIKDVNVKAVAVLPEGDKYGTNHECVSIPILIEHIKDMVDSESL